MNRVNRFLLIAGLCVAAALAYALAADPAPAGNQPAPAKPALRLGTDNAADESPDLNPQPNNVSVGFGYGFQYAQGQSNGGPGGAGGPPQGGPGPGMGGPGGGGPGMGGPGGGGPGDGGGPSPRMRQGGFQGQAMSPEMAHLTQLRMWDEMSFNPHEAGFMAIMQLKESLPPEEQAKAMEGYLDKVKSLGLRNAIRMALVDLYKAKGDKDSMRKQAEAMLMENDAALQNAPSVPLSPHLPPIDGGRPGRMPPPPASAPAGGK